MIGLELNDTGILAATEDGTLLPLDGNAAASPGVAVIDAGALTVGLAAEKSCRRIPRQTNLHFWDRLASEPLEDPAFAGWSHADLAHAHLRTIWEALAPAHQDVLVAVPDTYAAPQLELLAGVMHALAIPVRGFIALPLAALPKTAPAEILLHLDLHRHRTVLTVLDNRREAAILGRVPVDGLGLDRLRAAWMQVIADEFVRHTRFDPFHAAEAEQTLYDRLPALLADLATDEEAVVEMSTPSASHRIRLARSQLERCLAPLMDAVHRQVVLLKKEFWGHHPLNTMIVSHRAARLPGIRDRLAAAAGTRMVPLPEGAAAIGALAFENAFPHREGRRGVPFLNRRPGKDDADGTARPALSADEDTGHPAPTHLLYRSRGYPVGERPLVIGRVIPDGSAGIPISGRTEGVSRRHCSVMRRDGRLILTDTSTYGTFVNGIKITGETELAVGQSIRVGTPGEELQVIACLDDDETTNA